MIIVFVQVQDLSAQKEYIIDIQDFTPDNGLASQFSNFAFVDSRGITWFGTQAGLNRYDGQELKLYDEEETGFPFNQIMEIYEDNEGYFWLYRSCIRKPVDYCFKDLFFFHPITEEVLTIEQRFGDKMPFEPKEIDFILEAKNHQSIGILTQKGTFLWNTKSGFRKIPSNKFEKNPSIFTVLEDGRMGCFHNNTYYLLDKNGKVVHHENLNKLVSTGDKIYINNLKICFSDRITITDANENITLAANQTYRYYKVNAKGKLVIDAHLSDNQVIQIDGSRQQYYSEPQNTYWLAGNFGIRKIKKSINRFRHFTFPHKLVWDILPYDKERLFVGSTGYITILNPKTNAKIDYKINREEESLQVESSDFSLIEEFIVH